MVISRIGQTKREREREHQQLVSSVGTVKFPSKNDLSSGESVMPDKDTRILTLEKQNQNRNLDSASRVFQRS